MQPYASKLRSDVDVDAPMETLHHSHDRIVTSLHALAELPQLVRQLKLARELASQVVNVFDGPVVQHHLDEERVLFPSVIACAQPGDEVNKARDFAETLTAQHRSLEASWRALQRPLRAVARGNAVDLDPEAIQRLVSGYAAHALLEEKEYLPFAESVLGRDSRHLAAFAISLHLSHVEPIMGHI